MLQYKGLFLIYIIMDPFAELRSLPSEPKFWESNEKNRLNMEYNEWWIKFSEKAEKLWATLWYKPFKPFQGWEEKKEDKWNVDENVKKVEQKKDLEKFKENPCFPIIERFSELPWIELTDDDLGSINKALKDDNSNDVLWSLELLINDKNLEFSNPETKKYLSNYLNKIKDLNWGEKRKPKEKKDNRDLENVEKEEVKIPESFKNYEFLNDEKNPTIQLLIDNHLEIPEWQDWKPNQEKDLETTFNVSVNKLIDKKNFPRTESFELALKDVRDWNIETKFNALQYIYSFVQKKEWWKWRGDVNSYNKIRTEHGLKKQDYFDFKINQLEKHLKNENEWEKNWEKIKKLEIEIQKYKDWKGVDDFEWDVFEAWKLDKSPDELPDNSPDKYI